ncbi:unnamed protein product [Allacma fusca]|uniref:Aminopeptidase n=1 Tax=Allacma fusca TaxID=39272 RepID=A0A8J2PQ99_9HEXA|nr:unnamed protein product [Allacma fusca]
MLFWSLVALFFIAAFLYHSKRGRPVENLPPAIHSKIALVGGLRLLFSTNVETVILNIGKKQGPITRLNLGLHQIIFINGASAIKEAGRLTSLSGFPDVLFLKIMKERGMVTPDDSKELRKFYLKNVKEFDFYGKTTEDKIQAEVTEFLDRVRAHGSQVFDVKRSFNIHTINTMFGILFELRMEQDDQKLQELLKMIEMYMDFPSSIGRICLLLPRLGDWVPSYFSGKYMIEKFVLSFVSVVERNMEVFLQSRIPNQPRNYTDALMDKVDDTSDESSVFHSSQKTWVPFLIDVLLAAVETTSATLEWAVLFLSQFPDVQRKLQDEIDEGIVPTHYNLFIRPILDETENPTERFTAPGIVKITFKCQKPTSQILVHAVEIDIEDNLVQIQNRLKEETLYIKSQEHFRADSVYNILLIEPLKINTEYILTIAFTSLVSKERLTGLYLSNYTDPVTNGTSYIAATQFESIEARKAFPCFDNVDLKATFTISVGRKLCYNSISNMNLVNIEPIDGLTDWVWDHYATTPKMSTYLVAFIVSQFASYTASVQLSGGKPVKGWEQPKYINAGHGAYIAEISARTLNFYDNYFDTSYPLPKMDIIGLPHFDAGAMENWGAITVLESEFLNFGRNTTETDRFWTTLTITHELAHQNFGNLVTLKRWTHLWLNEGFAEYICYLGTNLVAPEFKPFDLFTTQTFQPALNVDTGTNALVNDSISNLNSTGDFGWITYNKGSSLIRMMRGFLGEGPLQKGLQTYLHTFAYSNALSDDLFGALNTQANLTSARVNLTVKDVMDTYILKPGYPLVRVTLGKHPHELIFTQEKFFANHSADHSHITEHWWVPLSIKTSLNPNFENNEPDLWIPKETLKVHWRGKTEIMGGNNLTYDWLIVNPKLGGYYRVVYDHKLTILLQAQLQKNHSAFPAPARAQFIDDYFKSVDSDYVQITVALGFTKYLGVEREYIVWTATFLNMKRIYSRMRSGKLFLSFVSYFRPKVIQTLNAIGWYQPEAERGLNVMLRANLLDWACNLEDPDCLKISKELVQSWMDAPNEPNPIPVDVQQVMICGGISSSEDTSIWEFVWGKYLESGFASERTRFISALCCSKNVTQLEFLINTGLNKTSAIKSSDASVLLQRLAASSIGNELVFSKIKGNLTEIVERFGGAEEVANAISALSIYWNYPEQLLQLKHFVGAHLALFRPVMGLIRSSIKIVEDNVRWVKRHEKHVSHWMDANC